MSRLRSVVVALTAILASNGARAADQSAALVLAHAVTLQIDPCVTVEPARLADLLTLELGVLTEAGAHSSTVPTQARVDCAGSAVVLTVSDISGAPSADRRLDWSAYPAGSRPRLLALALSEMIARRWTTAAAAPRPISEATVVAASASPPRPRFDLGLLASWERMGRPSENGAGLELAFGWHVRSAFLSWLTLQTGARATASSFDASPGSVSARTLSVLVATLVGMSRGRLWLGAGPGVRGGWARLRGEPTGTDPMGRTFAAGWWGPFAVGRASIRLTERLVVMASIEAGLVARPVIGEIGPPAPAPAAVVAVDALWLTAAAGAGWAF